MSYANETRLIGKALGPTPIERVDLDPINSPARWFDGAFFREALEFSKRRRIPVAAGVLFLPRGLLEFQVDPTSPIHKPELGGEKKLVLYCGSGGRSALGSKALKQMGMMNVAHVAGGFPALQKSGAPPEEATCCRGSCTRCDRLREIHSFGEVNWLTVPHARH